jgi:hypothetical protein
MHPSSHRTRLHGSLLAVAFTLSLAGCGGGGPEPTTPTPPAPPTTPNPVVTLSAAPGSSQHAALAWTGGSAGSTWRLERRRESGSDYTLLGTVDGASGLWMDSGLSADTAYSYRLSTGDGRALATTSLRTGTEAVLSTATPEAVGDALSLPISSTTSRITLPEGTGHLDLPSGSFSQSGTLTLQAISNPLPDGEGLGMSLTLPVRPAQTLTLSLRYDADEDADEVLQDRLAIQQADGSWWLLPLAAHDAAQRTLQVKLPRSVWVDAAGAAASAAPPTALAATSTTTSTTTATTSVTATATATATGVTGRFVRVKAHKLVPASASVRVLGSQRFVPVSIYRAQPSCDSAPTGDLCIPMPVLVDQELPILNVKAGYRRQWTLEGSTTPPPTLGVLNVQSGAGVVYVAPGSVPATNPLTLKFETVNVTTGLRLVLSAKVRVVDDAWQGRLEGFVGQTGEGSLYRANIRWNLDPALSTDTQRVYRPAEGYAEHLYTILDPVCSHTVTPTRLPLAQAGPAGQLVVDESLSPPRYTLELSLHWDATLSVVCPRGSTSGPMAGGHVWQASGSLSNGRIEGSDHALGDRSWLLERPQ